MLGGETLEAVASPHRTIREGLGLSAARSYDRALRVVEQEGWVRKRTGDADAGSWALEMTERGWEDLMDGIDPESAWSSSWDGLWRTVSFDLPAELRAERHQLDAWLAKRRFGRLQGSLWITHRAYGDWSAQLEKRRVDPRQVVFQEGRAIGVLQDVDYVKAAWNFSKIDDQYRAYLGFLDTGMDEVVDAASFAKWHSAETLCWNRAFALDPFLPDALLPSGYLGKEAWRRRREAFSSLAAQALAG